MRTIEMTTHSGRVGFIIVPFNAADGDAMGITEAARSSAKLFGYAAFFVVNRDRIRGWRQGSDQTIVDLDGAVLRPYAVNSTDLETAGESVLAGLVKLWVTDLQSHWRYELGRVPGEPELKAAGLLGEVVEGAVAAP